MLKLCSSEGRQLHVPMPGRHLGFARKQRGWPLGKTLLKFTLSRPPKTDTTWYACACALCGAAQVVEHPQQRMSPHAAVQESLPGLPCSDCI